MARVIILNGPGSVGKSTVARALQEAAPVPLPHVAMDAFLDMLPATMQDHPEGVSYLPGDGGVRVLLGPAGLRLMEGMQAAVAALAQAGNDLVVDLVQPATALASLRARLAGHRTLVVGLDAALPVLEKREAARGDRMAGLARDQVAWVHAGQDFDLRLDTGLLTPADCAARILDALGGGDG